MKATKSKIRCGGMLTILVLRSELLRRVALVLALGLMVCQAKVSEAEPMGTAFTYQGRLMDANSAADGLYDFQFKLYDDANTVTGNQVGSTIDINDLDVIDGSFTLELDFGSVFDGNARWLEIGVRPGDSTGSFTTLSPRQEITPVPYALQTRGIFVDDVPCIDYPNTWTAKESNREWASVAMSADGTKQTAVVYFGGQIYVSTDSGNTWTAKKSNRWWQSVAMSADGTKQTAVVCDGDGKIYVSTDSGNTWTAKKSNRSWYSVAMSADGTKQTAVVNGGRIYVCSAIFGFAYKVGIGTTNPQGELDVNGSIYQRGSPLHADYVFEPDYELESIDKHSEFMWQHKHLAAIPKAKVDENGQEIIEVGAHRRGIVEELEKAHIYIEQLHKQNKALETRLVKLEAIVARLNVSQKGGIE